MDTANLKKKYRTWYVQLRVPAPLVPIIGKRLLTRSLKTHDVAEAVRRKHSVLAEFHRMLRLAERIHQTSNDHPIDQLIAESKLLLDRVLADKVYPEDALEEFTELSDETYTDWVKQNPDKWIGDLTSDTQARTLQDLRKAVDWL
jgi:hypothetical protein